MFDLIFQVSLTIIVVGGALVILLTIFVMIKLIILLGKINSLTSDVIDNYELAKNIFFAPITYLKKIFKN
ncbi:hypothetical protein [Candidatus Vampirococcus lugosii]|uniref:Uncharacterized protein n=1 Tax=Candidatus Vampirococcus lugosii TaxID=2789015 RepID=A0ABS5QLV6_9BACT|nr:hypothetical protein [Candidatus Vampirococcus lugosii]MBS8121459.1 hypothetical protein [Candidatus Vampirococcus lugosii]